MKFKTVSFILLQVILILVSCGKNGTGPQPDPQPHFTVQPQSVNVQTDRASISWQTDVQANSIVRYGTSSGSYTLNETINSATLDHYVTLLKLQSNTVYYYVAESQNSGGTATSGEQQFTTLRTLDDLIQSAWDNFQNGSYSDAISQFKEILQRQPDHVDAMSGLGWSYSSNEIDSVERALEYFNFALAARPTYADALAGRGFVRLALKEYAASISDFSQLLAVNQNFVFSHKPSIDFKDIRLAMAEAYFVKKSYDLCQEQVDLLDPGNGLDPGRAETWIVDGVQYNSYPEALLALIEKLKTIT